MGLKLKYDYGQTPLDEDEKEGLRIKIISTQGELNEFEQLNIEKAIKWVINIKLDDSQILNEKFIRTVHHRMYSEVWNWAGQFRKSEKNIGVPWTSIALELKKLIDDTKFWIEENIFEPDEIAIRFKHRLVSIHCFPNGNGRHSRLMADILIEAISHNQPFSWHFSNMIKPDQTRKLYIKALQEADRGDIQPLVLFARG